MRHAAAFVLFILLINCHAAASSAETQSGAEPTAAADLILCNGRVFTMDASRSWADAIAIAGERIKYVGTKGGTKSLIGPKTKVVDLKGKMVLPGFIDSHVHPLDGGATAIRCDLTDAPSRQVVLERMRTYLAAHPLAPNEWFIASGWNLTLWPKGNPHKADLDKIVGERPALVYASDFHSAWVNSAALRLAKIDESTVEPPSGRIERDPKTKEPTGTLRESAMQLVSSRVPPTSLEDRVRFLLKGLQLANSFGITSLQDASVDEPILQAYKHVQEQGKLTVRTVAALLFDPDKGMDQIENIKRLRMQYGGGLLRPTSTKLFVDGVIETHTAALLQPYQTKGHATSGTLNYSPESLKATVTKLDAEGFQIHMHTIGDRAAREALDALAVAESKNGKHDLRHQLAHLELVDPADVPRFRDQDAIANFEPYWFCPDSFIVDFTEPVVGKERSSRLYPMRSLVKSGAVVTAGSDWPVTTLNPLEGIEVAVTRSKPGSALGTKPWLPDQCMDLTDAIAAYTINGAFFNHEDKDAGSIEVGKYADLIVLDKNLFAIPPTEIHNAKVIWTLLAGKEVFRDTSW